jgi:hypothetical protein
MSTDLDLCKVLYDIFSSATLTVGKVLYDIVSSADLTVGKVLYDICIAVMTGVFTGFFVDSLIKHRESKNLSPARSLTYAGLLDIIQYYFLKIIPSNSLDERLIPLSQVHQHIGVAGEI